MKKNKSMLFYENKYYQKGFNIIGGIDEVGRGCWAGPVVAACVIFPRSYENTAIKDSKVLSQKKRQQLYFEIKKNALAYGIGYCSAKKIDQINIKKATILAMQKAVKQLKIKPDCLLIDAEEINNDSAIIVPIIKGDTKSISIAAASIIAKVTRDNFLNIVDEIFPLYGFKKHKGYGTLSHLKALKKYGPINNFHRMSFAPISKNFKN